MTDTASSTYQPGVCNINPAETAYRRKAGWAGVIITLLLALPFFVFDINRLVRIILVLPVFLSAVSFLQAKHHFCVSYAASGLQNASGDKIGTTARVKPADQDKDRATSNRIYRQAALIAATVTLCLVTLP